MKITVETVVKAKLNKVWDVWNNPADIKQWNAAQDDWHTSRSTVDLREGGRFQSRMEARDGSEGFDLEGTYTRIVPHRVIEYQMSDGREVKVEFIERDGGVLVKETFDAETETRQSSSARAGRPSWTTSAGTCRRRVEPDRLNPRINARSRRWKRRCS